MEDSPHFLGLHFWVADFERTAAFYRTAGLDVPEPEGGFLNFSLPGGINLAFGTDELTRSYDPAFEPPARAKSAVALQFQVSARDAVDKLHGKLIAAGYRSHLAPIDAFWRARYAEVLDPDGNVVGFHGRGEPTASP